MELRLELKASRQHLSLILVVAVAALSGIWTAQQAPTTSLILVLLWCLFLYRAWRTYRAPPTRLKMGHSNIELELAGFWQSSGNPKVLPLVIVFPSGWRDRVPMIWSDSLEPDQWRQLRMALKIRSIQTAADNHVLPGKIDRHHNGVLSDRR